MIAEVVLNSITKATDNIYHYLIPDDLTDVVKVGVRVLVPFGRGNKTAEAYVINLVSESEYKNLKQISSVEDPYSYFDENAVELVHFMKHRYFCTYISAIKSMIPTGVGTRFKKTISLTQHLTDDNQKYIEHSIRASQIYSLLLPGPMSFDKLTEHITSKNLTSVLNTMQKRGIITIEENIQKGLKDTMRKRVTLAIEYEQACIAIDNMIKKAPARARCLEFLCDEHDMYLHDLLECANTSKSVVDYLESKGYVYTYECIER